MLLTDILTADQKDEDKFFLKIDYGQWILNIKPKKKLNVYMNYMSFLKKILINEKKNNLATFIENLLMYKTYIQKQVLLFYIINFN